MKNNNKGLTLIEVIVSIALLGIICGGMITTMTTHYSLFKFTRVMTHNLFEAQQLIEQRIEEVKQGVQSGILPMGQVRTAYTLFEGANQRTVYGYPNTAEISLGNSNMKLFTIAADMSVAQFEVPSASNVQIDLSNGNIIPYAYVSTPSLMVKSQFTLDDPQNVFLTGINRWYVSRQGFNIPSISNPLEIEKGTLYPRFPEDYVLITGATNKDLSTITPTFAGRHLLYTVTPASVSGKMGKTEMSNPVFVSGLPVRTNLKLHLDASLISKESSTDVNIISSIEDGLEVRKYYVREWQDISGNQKKALQTNVNNQPELIETKVGNTLVSGLEYETFVKFLRFEGNQGLQIADESYFDLNNLTVIAVMRSTATTDQKTIVSKIGNTSNYNDSWRLGWNSSDQLGFFIKDTSTRSNSVSGDVGGALDGNWHVLSGSSQLTLRVDEGNLLQSARTFTQSIENNRNITIGYDGDTDFSTVDVAEILIYEGAVSETDLTLIRKYLMDKYKPIEPVPSIYALKSMKETVIKGTVYTMPSTILAFMSNSTMMETNVTWSPDIDTSTIGKKLSIATSVADPSKTTTLQVDVVEIESLENKHIKVEKDTVYSVMNTVVANLSNGTTQEVEVTWDVSVVDTSKVGTTNVVGTSILNPSESMTLKVTVSEGVKGVVLSDSFMTLDVDQLEVLVATLTPSDAFNQNVIWTSNNPSVVSVSNVGVVIGVSTGSAIITVTTVHGGFTANCLVTVN